MSADLFILRQETYGYFTLPFCRGMKEEISHYHETIGEALQVFCPFKILYFAYVEYLVICNLSGH